MKNEKQDRRSRRTRSLITNAMMELLGEQRYETITVQDILDRAEIGRSTFYVHYFDKEDVLASIAEGQLEMMVQQLATGNAGQDIVPSLGLFQHVGARYPYFQSVMRGHSGEVLWQTVREPLRKTVEQALMGAQSEKRTLAVPVAVMAQYLTGTLLNLLKWWLEAEMPYTPEQMDEMFRRLAMPGLWAALEQEAR